MRLKSREVEMLVLMPAPSLSIGRAAWRERLALKFTVKPLGGYGCVFVLSQTCQCQIPLVFFQSDGE